MKRFIKCLLAFSEKPWGKAVLLVPVSVVVFYWNSHDWKFSFQMTLFMFGLYLFNFSIWIYYRDLKKNRFNFKATASPKSWMYFSFMTIGTVLAFWIFLSKVFWVYAVALSVAILVPLFIIDLIRNGLR